ncbi:MAG TPA: GreA/GreB family elongation factor [Luteibacter sp.]|jgi:transcription elongation factor GreB|nr:GreA/GreB family elongation factor [Luteibacter sp.]
MSQAFVKEHDAPPGDDLPDIPISEHHNYVTPQGFASLRKRLDHALAERDRVQASGDSVDKASVIAALERDLRWLQSRVGSATEIDPADQPRDRVAFGARATVVTEEGERHAYRIVGEDEADAEHGKVSYVSPLARALLGAKVGDEVSWHRPAGDIAIEVVGIDYSDA